SPPSSMPTAAAKRAPSSIASPSPSAAETRVPKITEERREERRRQILDAAVACFARKGFHRASMQDIIAASGLSPGSIYCHFKGKEEIIEAIADERHAQETALL